MDRNQCVNADWYAIGLEDGARGRALERLGDHRRACAQYSVAPDTARYLAGRNEGLKSFCTYERGFSEGRAGNYYAAACPAPAASAFLAGYNRGRELHDLHRRLDDVEREIAGIKSALTQGIKEPGLRAEQVERLEALTRESDELQARIAQVERP
jgi:hypothetical protein